MKYPFFSKKVRIFAHRGDSLYFPENTLAAFTSAAEIGVDCIETDVHLSLDGVCVIWHDDTMENITGEKTRVCEKTLPELLSIDAGMMFSRDGGLTFPFRGKGIHMTTLEEVLNALPDMRFNIDLKDKSKKLVKEFVRIVSVCKAEKRVLGASFHFENLNLLRRYMPDLPTSFSEPEARKIVLLQKTGLLSFKEKFTSAAFQVPEFKGPIKIVTGRMIRILHKKNIKIQVWTVNQKDDMHRLISMGVDGIFTDNPRLLKKVIKEVDNDSKITV